uniref:Pentacotripeptide-repeat region of PRORP domain-containing protein n=1 Tax=Manihot esculenta TaxID=3983 RepID=A0A2C9VSC5_MANES
MILKPLSFPSNLRYATKPQLPLLCRLFFSTNPTSVDQDVEVVYRIITSSSSPEDLKQSINSSGIFLNNDLIDKVLKRVRFGHGNPLQALEFFKFTANRKGFYHTPNPLDTMLYILGRSRQFDHIWDVLIKIVAQVCSVRQTVESFRRFKELVPVFDTISFNALLRTLCQEKTMADARNVYHTLKKEFRPNLQAFNMLLSGWKSSEEAESFFEEMKELGVKPDVVSYNSLIDVYCKGREMEKAYKVLEKMREEDISPVITYTSIIGVLGLIGQPDKARDVLKEMKEYGCYPDVAAYNAAIRNYCIAKRLGDASSLMEEMVSQGFSPNATTYNLFFRVFYWSNDLRRSWSLYRRMMDAGCLPNSQSCMFLVRLFKKHEKVDLALLLWNDMVEKDFGSYTLVYDVLFDLLCDFGRLAEAEKRIKILMELANKHDGLQNLSEKMAIFGSSIQVPKGEEHVDRTLCYRLS